MTLFLEQVYRYLTLSK